MVTLKTDNKKLQEKYDKSNSNIKRLNSDVKDYREKLRTTEDTLGRISVSINNILILIWKYGKIIIHQLSHDYGYMCEYLYLATEAKCQNPSLAVFQWKYINFKQKILIYLYNIS